MTPTTELNALGQSLWLDNITRQLLTSGTLRRYIDELSVTGLTSNPTIFHQAMKGSADYDDDIRAKHRQGLSGEALFFDLALHDIGRAADLFAAVHERTHGVDGWVSLEVSPLLAYDTQTTLQVARELHARAAKPNLFIKIPGTAEGLPTIEEATFAGVPINVTLLFSTAQYVAAAEAWLRGIERRLAAGLSPYVTSVASLFVSRWDVAVADTAPAALRMKLGIAVAMQAYRAYGELLASPRYRPRAERRCAGAAAADGQHRNQGPVGFGHAVCRSAGRALHRQHDARSHAEGLCRPWQAERADPGRRRRLRGRAGAVQRRRHRSGRAGGAAAARRGGVVRQVVARADGGDRREERGAGLTGPRRCACRWSMSVAAV